MEEIYEVKQIQPNHADHISGYNQKFLDKMFNEEKVIAQPKYDGERMLMHINHGKVYCTSRRISKLTKKFMENQDKLPMLQDIVNNNLFAKDLDYTVLDCECYSKDWSTIVGILHSLPERAIELQKSNTPKFAVFDCLYFNGIDIRNREYEFRYEAALITVNILMNKNIHIVRNLSENYICNDNKSLKDLYIKNNDDWKKCMNNAISQGFEGVVIKSLNKLYYDKGASLKCKKFETIDVVVIDFKQGTGKYSNTIGALCIGYYDKDKNSFVKISNVNCSTDEERNLWYNNWNKLKYSVIEVKCQEITDKSLRHPVYIRRRNDKDYTMCTYNTIFK